MELNKEELIDEGRKGGACDDHDSRDAKVERRRQQNRRNAQAWSKYSCPPQQTRLLE